jgi:hypothetical protein
LAAKVRHVRQPKTAQLEPHREELLRLRRAGDSVEVLATALRGLDVEISAEALRLWLNRELGHKPSRRRKVRMPITRHGAKASSLIAEQEERAATALSMSPAVTDLAAAELLSKLMNRGADRPSSLILPGETPLPAIQRRLAALGQTQAKDVGVN